MSFIEIVARIIVEFYGMLWPFLAAAGFVGAPVLGFYFLASLPAIWLADYDERPWTPAISWLRYLVIAVYGILLPSVYFLCVRTKWSFGPYFLGSETNRPWCIAVGVVCVAFLLYQALAALLRLRGWRAAPGWAGIVIFGMGALLAWRYQIKVGAAMMQSGRYAHEPIYLPMVTYGGATLVYTLAFIESLARRRRGERCVRISRPVSSIAGVMCAAMLLLVYSPFLLSIPRETRAHTLGLIRANAADIHAVSRHFKFDPRLLSGIIYVAHTRDRPRWTGDAIEALGSQILEQSRLRPIHHFGFDADTEIIDPSVGLVQMKASTHDWLTPTNGGVLTPDPEMYAALAGGPHHSHNGLVSAAFYLSYFRNQWREANPAWSIGERPEILATLYNIGHERSEPKADPKPNDFGRRVLAAMSDAELIEALGSAPAAEAAPMEEAIQ